MWHITISGLKSFFLPHSWIFISLWAIHLKISAITSQVSIYCLPSLTLNLIFFLFFISEVLNNHQERRNLVFQVGIKTE